MARLTVNPPKLVELAALDKLWQFLHLYWLFKPFVQNWQRFLNLNLNLPLLFFFGLAVYRCLGVIRIYI